MNFWGGGNTRNFLQEKYYSSQVQYHSQAVASIVLQRRNKDTIYYDSIEDYIDNEEYLKRFYHQFEYGNKLMTFKEYYFYHEDCPRIFMTKQEIIYAKWQDRRRNLVYKKLKRLLNESEYVQSEENAQVHQFPSHFLFEISDYNPFSKKYYLRVQKQSLLKKEEIKQTVVTKDEISMLRHDLSEMLQQITDLSAISTIQSPRGKQKIAKYHRKNLTQVEGISQELSNHNSSSSIKFNFKRNKISYNSTGSKNNEQFQPAERKKANYQLSTTPNKKQSSKETIPSLNQNRAKSKTVFEITGFSTINKKQDLGFVNPKKSQLKINFHPVIKISSSLPHSKFEPAHKKETIQIKCKSKSNSKNKNQIIGRQNSLRKLKTKTDEFSDYKLSLIKKNINLKPSLEIIEKPEMFNSKKNIFKIKNQKHKTEIGNCKPEKIKGKPGLKL